MPDFLPAFGRTAGPLGVPCTDEQAFALDQLCREIPDPEVKRLQIPKLLATSPTERTDESWITTEDPDRVGDIILARGMDASHFLRNPVVALNHAYWLPPVGRCLRLWNHRDDTSQGIKALTHYPPRPDDHAGEWPPDDVWHLIKAGLLVGKSIGLLPTKRRDPTSAESARGIRRMIEEWTLIEDKTEAVVPSGGEGYGC